MYSHLLWNFCHVCRVNVHQDISYQSLALLILLYNVYYITDEEPNNIDEDVGLKKYYVDDIPNYIDDEFENLQNE